MSKKLLKYYLLSALVSAPVSAADQQAEAGRLGKSALQLMSEEKNIALGSIVASVLEELQRIPGWGLSGVIENINSSLKDLPGKDSPIVDELLSYLGRFYPDVAGQLRFPQHALPVAPAAAAAAAVPVAPPAAIGMVDEVLSLKNKALSAIGSDVNDSQMIGAFVYNILEELNHHSIDYARIAHTISDFLIKPNDLARYFDVKIKKPLIAKLIKFIGRFHPELMGQMEDMSRAPQYAQYPRSVGAEDHGAAAPAAANIDADAELARRMQEEKRAAAANIDADAEVARRMQEKAIAESEQRRLAQDRATEDLLVREEEQRLANKFLDEEQGAEAARALKAGFDAERAEQEQVELRDHEAARMIEVIEALPVVDETKERFIKVSLFYGAPHLLAHEQQLVIDAIHGLRNLSNMLIRRIEASFVGQEGPISMDSIHAILRKEDQIRREELMRIEAERQAKVERLRADARAKEEEAARDAAFQRMALEHGGIWRIPAFGVTPEVVFNMPAGLSLGASKFIKLFMDKVQPKLFELLKGGKITHKQYNKVIRAVSMGAFGLEFADDYKKIIVDNARNNRFGDISEIPERAKQEAGKWLASPTSHTVKILGPLERDEDPGSADTWMYIHLAEHRGEARAKVEGAIAAGKTKVQAIKELADFVVDGRISALSMTIQKFFETLIDKNATDAQWSTVVGAFNTNRCFDGTLEDITVNSMKTIGELEADGVVADRLGVLNDKIMSDEFSQIFGQFGSDFNTLVVNAIASSALYEQIQAALDDAEPLGDLQQEHFQKTKDAVYQQEEAAIKAEEARIKAAEADITQKRQALLTEEEKTYAGEQKRHQVLRIGGADEATVQESRGRLNAAQQLAEVSNTEAVKARKDQFEVDIKPAQDQLEEVKSSLRARRAALPNMLVQTPAERQATIQRLDAQYAAIAEKFRGTTLEAWGISPDVANAIRAELGWKPGTRDPLYTDAENIELLFWVTKTAADGVFLPPVVAFKYRMAQELPPTKQ